MFRLAKWYLDGVTDTGDIVILYWASVEWGPFRLHYGASLYSYQSKEPAYRQTFRPTTEPIAKNGVVEWSCRELDFSGTWSTRMDGIKSTLVDEPRGRIRWHCISPSADATMCIDGDRIEGLGYVEHLTMTLKPWQLPFRELRWGRFVARTDSLIWIQWRDPTLRTWVWLNGIERQNVSVTEDRVELRDDGVTLDLQDNKVLRSGRLNTTALRSVRALTALMPGWRSAHETKWLARGTLNRPDNISNGWVVHEVVRWP